MGISTGDSSGSAGARSGWQRKSACVLPRRKSIFEAGVGPPAIDEACLSLACRSDGANVGVGGMYEMRSSADSWCVLGLPRIAQSEMSGRRYPPHIGDGVGVGGRDSRCGSDASSGRVPGRSKTFRSVPLCPHSSRRGGDGVSTCPTAEHGWTEVDKVACATSARLGFPVLADKRVGRHLAVAENVETAGSEGLLYPGKWGHLIAYVVV